MTRSTRLTKRRLWYMGLALAWSLFIALGSQGSTPSKTINDLRPSGQGWYWDRPAQSDDLFNPGLPSGGGNAATAADHLYVGWDGVNQRENMISGINFDLFQAGVPEGSKIVGFVITAIEHPAGENQSLNAAEAGKQGVMVCAMPQFVAGEAAANINNAPPRDCTVSVASLRPSGAVDPSATGAAITYAWSFDVTSLAAEQAQSGSQVAFSLQPAITTKSAQTWFTTFHSGDYSEKTTAADGTSVDVPKPGILVKVTYLPPVTEPEPDTSTSTGSAFDIGGFSDGPSFSDTSGSLAETLAPEPPPTVNTRRSNTQIPVAGVFEGKPAGFWDLPPIAWVSGILGLALLMASGWALNSDPMQGRPPGAASSLMAKLDDENGG
ncbi:MAG TPA: hypothetical protein VI541_00515 [Actinomycetota bacterium]|nr:hypothetical protein [Actinomycetota bacterium]